MKLFDSESDPATVHTLAQIESICFREANGDGSKFEDLMLLEFLGMRPGT